MQVLPDGQLYAPCSKCGELILIPSDLEIRVRCLREKDYTAMTAYEATQVVKHAGAGYWALVCVLCLNKQKQQP